MTSTASSLPRRGVARCLAAAVLFGASAPAASVLAGDMPTLVLAGLLYLGAALAVLPAVARHRPSTTALRAGGRPLALAVLFGGAIGPVLLVAGLERIPAASASLLLNFELVATIALAALVFREHLGRRLLAAVALLALAGVLLVWEPGAAIDLGGLLVIGACIAWGIDNSVTARIDQLRPEQITFAKGAVAGTANLLLGIAVAAAWQVEARQIAAALLIGALGYGLSITLWVKGARDLGAARGQVIFATAPFLGRSCPGPCWARASPSSKPSPSRSPPAASRCRCARATNTPTATNPSSTSTSTATTITTNTPIPKGRASATPTGTATSTSSTPTHTSPTSTTATPTDASQLEPAPGGCSRDEGLTAPHLGLCCSRG